MTIDTWAAEWQRLDRAHWKRRTARTYASVLRQYVLPVLGAVALADVDRRAVRLLLLAMRDRGLAPGTVRLTLATLRAMYAAAIDAELVAANPAVRLGRVVAQRHDVQRYAIPTPDEVRRLLAVAETQVPQWFPLLLLLARTGLRIGEACGLQWDDLDLEARIAHVRRTVGDGTQIGTPKSGEERAVDLSAALVLVLRGIPRAGLWVFRRDTRDAPVDQRLVNLALRSCAREAGVAGHVTCHGLRHAYASTLVALGVQLEYIARQLGHASTGLVSTCYGRHLPSHHPAHVDLLDAV